MRLCDNEIEIMRFYMKKIILILILVLCISFISCAKEPYTVENCTDTLVASGLVITESATDGQDLIMANSNINLEISAFMGNFSVKLLSYTALKNPNNDKQMCKIWEMETKEQANMYSGFYMNNRGENDGWKVTAVDNIVIATNISSVPKILNLIFE